MQIVTGKKSKAFLIITILLFIFTTEVFSQAIRLSAELDKKEIWLGETVRLTLYLEGSEEPISPNLSIKGVNVNPLGGTTRSSTSITSINGKVTKNIRKAYVYVYDLKPSSAGEYSIPSISIEVEGQTVSTSPKTLKVKLPEESDDFRFLLNFEREKLYLSEECLLSLRFEFEKNLNALSFSIPELEGVNFNANPSTAVGEKIALTINGKTVYFSQQQNNNYASISTIISFRPENTGFINLQNATATFNYVSGYRQVQDFFGRTQNQEVYSKKVIPSNNVTLAVVPYPIDSQPEGFFGLSGNVKVKANLKTTEANVGDPLTLSLTFYGLNNTNVKIPSLNKYLGRGINIPDTRAAAKVNGNTKTITQTIRIENSSINKIPPISFPFFNTNTEKYEYATTEEIPIVIHDTKVITAASVETPGKQDKTVDKIQLEKKQEGIYFNYSGDKLLETQPNSIESIKKSIIIPVLLLIPVLSFLVVLIITIILPRFRERSKKRLNRKKALSYLKKKALSINPEKLKEDLTKYNRLLQDFLELYGTPRDNKLIDLDVQLINSVLYGNNESMPNEVRHATLKIVETLGDNND